MWRQRDSNSKHLLAKEICYQLHHYPQIKQLVFTDLLLIVNGFCLISKLNYLIFTDLIVYIFKFKIYKGFSNHFVTLIGFKPMTHSLEGCYSIH